MVTSVSVIITMVTGVNVCVCVTMVTSVIVSVSVGVRVSVIVSVSVGGGANGEKWRKMAMANSAFSFVKFAIFRQFLIFEFHI